MLGQEIIPLYQGLLFIVVFQAGGGVQKGFVRSGKECQCSIYLGQGKSL